MGLDQQHLSDEEKSCTGTILEMEEELFNPKKAYLRWPVMQIYRNFIVVILNTFILNPIYRTIFFIPVFCLFLYHDRDRKPYKHPYLNVLQCLSSGCLLLIAESNIPAAIVVITNGMSVPLMGSVVMACRYIEMIMYAIVPMSLLGWKFREKCLVQKMSCKKRI